MLIKLQDRMSDIRLKRLRYRAWHRGTRELDLILGRFADANVDTMSEHELGAFEALLNAADPDIYHWVVGGAEADQRIDAQMIGKLRASLSDIADAGLK